MAIPPGFYPNVRVNSIHGECIMESGSGTTNPAGTLFTCGPFAVGDHPQVGSWYVFHSGANDFPGQCVFSGANSDFIV